MAIPSGRYLRQLYIQFLLIVQLIYFMVVLIPKFIPFFILCPKPSNLNVLKKFAAFEKIIIIGKNHVWWQPNCYDVQK